MKKKIRFAPSLSMGSFLLILLVWAILTYSGLVDKVFLPSPGQVIQAIRDMWAEGTLFYYTWMSTYRVLVGWALSVLLAVPLGMMLATSTAFRALFRPVTEFVRYLPVVALVPLTLLYFGIGESQKFAIIFLGTFFQLVLMVYDTISSVDKNLLNSAATLGANKWQCYRTVLLPASMPGLMDALRLTIGWAWTYLVVAEMVAANSGLGYMILRSQRFLATDRIFAGLLLIGVVGLVTDFLFRMLTYAAVPWNDRLDH